MRKLVLDHSDDGWSLRVGWARTPSPERGEVLIQVRASSLVTGELDWPSNWVDRMAHPRSEPVPGREFAGIVAALGVGVVGLAVGDRVFGWAEEYMDGAAADYVVALARNVAPLPASIDPTRAAALPFATAAAWQALFEHGAAVARDHVVVVGHRTVVGRVAMEFGHTAGLTMLTEKAFATGADGREVARRVCLVVDTLGGLALREVLARAARGSGTGGGSRPTVSGSRWDSSCPRRLRTTATWAISACFRGTGAGASSTTCWAR